jgi:hypothetical protein
MPMDINCSNYDMKKRIFPATTFRLCLSFILFGQIKTSIEEDRELDPASATIGSGKIMFSDKSKSFKRVKQPLF